MAHDCQAPFASSSCSGSGTGKRLVCVLTGGMAQEGVALLVGMRSLLVHRSVSLYP